MRVIPLFAAAMTAGLSVSGCAGGMTKAECADADWAALGLQDGRAGAPGEVAEKRKAACAGDGYLVDADAYDAARREGLETYCTPKGGFEAGRTVGEYFGACAGEQEAQFLTSFALGDKLHDLTEAKERAVRDYETAIADLDQHRYLLRVSEKRYLKPSISNEDREQERQDADFRRREIARIEGKIPEMLREIEDARAALEAYRIELLSMGLEL